MAVTATKLTGGNVGQMAVEVHHISWTSTTATVELTTNLEEIYFWIPGAMFGAAAGHAADNNGILELDETVTSGVITPASSAVTVNRFAATGTGTLAAQEDVVVLFGKS